jgi:hypothetical protein
VWYIRDEWARDHKVLHPHGGVLYKSGVYAGKALNLTPGDLPNMPRIVACEENWLKEQRCSLIIRGEVSRGHSIS